MNIYIGKTRKFYKSKTNTEIAYFWKEVDLSEIFSGKHYCPKWYKSLLLSPRNQLEMLAMLRGCIKFSLVYFSLITIKILSETIILETIRTIYLYKGENRFSNKTRFISIDLEVFSVIWVNYAWFNFLAEIFQWCLKLKIANYCIIFCMLFTHFTYCFSKVRSIYERLNQMLTFLLHEIGLALYLT